MTNGYVVLGASKGNSGEVLTSQGSSSVPVWAPATGGSGFTWQETGAGVAMVKGNGYIPNTNSQQTFTLPATAAVGDTFGVASWFAFGGSNAWLITCDSNHTIALGTQTAVTSLSSTAVGDTVIFICVYSAPPSYGFQVISVIGNITVV